MASRSSSSSNAATYLVWFSFLILCLCLLSADAAPIVHSHEFVVKATPVKRLCENHNIITVNDQFPGPTLEVRNGDTLIVKVVNQAQYNVTLHWHGVRQMRTAWADGPEYITQCPIKPGGSYTYKFTISGQEGTLWWHAHTSWMRATIYGAIVIYPKEESSYPFAQPQRETPIILGEWWNRNPMDVVRQAMQTGAAPNISNAFTINGQPGDLYPCSSKDTTIVPVSSGETNLFRFVNAAMNTDLFVSIAGHTMTVVGVDAAYTKPFATSLILLGPGQTTDVLVTANQSPSRRYYIAARAYAPARGVTLDNTTTTAILEYRSKASSSPSASTAPVLPALPAYNDTGATATFSAGIKSRFPKLPGPVDANFFFTIGLGLFNCSRNQRCGGPNNTRFGASQNNVSFALPNKLSILQAQYSKIPGVFTPDFPADPPKVFDFTARKVSRALWQPLNATKTLPIKYGSVVQIVLQDTNIYAADSHPMHLHGYQFYIVGAGFGNFDPERDTARFNLVDPPERNTVSVPVNGWAAIRFRADNPGAWLMHCHLDVHLTWGLATVLLVDNGVGELQTLEPPPKDLPPC